MCRPSRQPGEFAYADQGALYTTDKVMYISPAVAEPYLGGNFSAMASYEPNSNGIKEGYANCATAASGSTCAALSSTSTAGNFNAKARQNTFDVAGQYALKMNGFNSKVSAGFLDGSPMRYTGAPRTPPIAWTSSRSPKLVRRPPICWCEPSAPT